MFYIVSRLNHTILKLSRNSRRICNGQALVLDHSVLYWRLFQIYCTALGTLPSDSYTSQSAGAAHTVGVRTQSTDQNEG